MIDINTPVWMILHWFVWYLGWIWLPCLVVLIFFWRFYSLQKKKSIRKWNGSEIELCQSKRAPIEIQSWKSHQEYHTIQWCLLELDKWVFSLVHENNSNSTLLNPFDNFSIVQHKRFYRWISKVLCSSRTGHHGRKPGCNCWHRTRPRRLWKEI